MTILARWQRSVVDDAGNIQTGAQVEVRLETAGFPLATLYSDRAGTAPIANPLPVEPDGFCCVPYRHRRRLQGARLCRSLRDLRRSKKSGAMCRSPPRPNWTMTPMAR
jgi:hypothetical protein